MSLLEFIGFLILGASLAAFAVWVILIIIAAWIID